MQDPTNPQKSNSQQYGDIFVDYTKFWNEFHIVFLIVLVVLCFFFLLFTSKNGTEKKS